MIGFFAAGAIGQSGPPPADGFPNIYGIQTTASSATTSHSISVPSGASGDLLIMLLVVAGTVTISTPSGWTSAINTNSGGRVRLRAVYKISDGSESSVSVTVGSSVELSAIVLRVEAGTSNAGSGPELSAGSAPSSPQNFANPPSLTPSWGSAKTSWVAIALLPTNISSVSSWPYTDQQTWVVSPGGAPVAAAISTTKVESGSVDPGNFTYFPNTYGVGVTMGIRPA